MKGVGGFFLHGNEIPDKFIQNEVPSVHFDVPQFNGDDFLGVNEDDNSSYSNGPRR